MNHPFTWWHCIDHNQSNQHLCVYFSDNDVCYLKIIFTNTYTMDVYGCPVFD